MHYLLLLLLLEGFKKFWVETGDSLSRRRMLLVHTCLFALYVLFTIYSYVPDYNPYEDVTPENYDGGVVIRPQDAQAEVDARISKKAANYAVSQWFLSVTGVMFIVSLILSTVHSIRLYKRFKPELVQSYNEVGNRLRQLVLWLPFVFALSFILVTVGDTHGYSTEPYRGFEYLFLFTFLTVVFLILAFYRLSDKDIYRPNWTKTIGQLFLSGFIVFVIVVLLLMYAIATTDFSH